MAGVSLQCVALVDKRERSTSQRPDMRQPRHHLILLSDPYKKGTTQPAARVLTLEYHVCGGTGHGSKLQARYASMVLLQRRGGI